MKKLVLIFALLGSCELWSADLPPTGGNVVNQWIELALRADMNKLTQRKWREKFACQRVGSDDQTFAKNIEQAHAKAVVLCIRKRCDGIEDEVNAEVDRMRGLNPEEVIDLITAAGHGVNAEQILELLRSGGYGGPTNCQTSQQARYAIYDSCALRAYSCGKFEQRRK